MEVINIWYAGYENIYICKYEVYVDKDGRLETFFDETIDKQLNNGKH